jgi:hypothetical protein
MFAFTTAAPFAPLETALGLRKILKFRLRQAVSALFDLVLRDYNNRTAHLLVTQSCAHRCSEMANNLHFQ